ncbi:Tungstate uptake system permease protein TupB [Methylobacterium crusticola]|uniref:Tungstate uptake system permease protein TupB n=1 Tax=Methylobacterium crusticola TaxID=1697972 RepID=A0ABQ4R091_9HYPH|nr:ABC transporter permease [Methylobacterium crusticola]GJD50852.1 Tungstate uptake system permease protein TupB [Methylobacterium crusticola]
MDEFGRALGLALQLILRADAELVAIVGLSLRVSLAAAGLGFVLGAPLGALIAATRFPGRTALLVVLNALLGLPPVVVGLVLYLLVSRAGPLGGLGLLFTPGAMVLAQCLLALPIVAALAHRACEGLWAEYGDALRIDGVGRGHAVAILLAMAPAPLLTAFLAAFGRAIAEVGAILMVGGNIRGHTRTMTTSIALETSRGDLAQALGLGLILLAVTLLVSALAFGLSRAALPRG